MRRRLLVIISSMVVFVVTTFGQPPHTILFYNVENFFDTINDLKVNDREFTPKGRKRWTSDKYYKKLSNIERVLLDITAGNGDFPLVIGLAEVESRVVLEDIISTEELAPTNYSLIHFDSPDKRGIDVAFLYRTDKFELEGALAERAQILTSPKLRTRDILTMWGSVEGESLFFMVTHWPSRMGGEAKTAPLREAHGGKMRQIVDSVRAIRPNTKFVLMGDFNDNSNDKSVEVNLGAKYTSMGLSHGELFNPYYSLFVKGFGSSVYNDSYNLFDNIIVSENLVNAKSGELQLQRSIYDSLEYGNIFRRDYLFQTQGHFKGYPYRSFSGNTFIGGYSDHLPVFINIGVE